jgi:L-asparagine transporter-like permease
VDVPRDSCASCWLPGGIAAFVPAWLTAAGIRAFSFVSPLSAPYSEMALWIGGVMVIALICLIVLYATDPKRVREVGLVHLDVKD